MRRHGIRPWSSGVEDLPDGCRMHARALLPDE